MDFLFSSLLLLHFNGLDFSNLFSDPLKTDGTETETEVAKFVESSKANPMLLDKDGYVFTANRKRGRKIYWLCRENKNMKCPAKASTNGIYVTKWTDKHNHEKRPIQLRDYDRKYKKRDSWGNKVKKSGKTQEDDI